MFFGGAKKKSEGIFLSSFFFAHKNRKEAAVCTNNYDVTTSKYFIMHVCCTQPHNDNCTRCTRKGDNARSSNSFVVAARASCCRRQASYICFIKAPLRYVGCACQSTRCTYAQTTTQSIFKGPCHYFMRLGSVHAHAEEHLSYRQMSLCAADFFHIATFVNCSRFEHTC